MLFALLATQQTASPVEVFGKDCGLRIVRCGTELVEEIYAVDARKQQSLILVSPTHPAVRSPGKEERTANLLSGVESGLFQKPPTFAFSGVSRDGNTVVLKSVAGGWKIEKRITVPRTGNQLDVQLQATTDSPYPQIRYLLNSYAFAPGTPDTTWAPAIRPQAYNVIGDHFFRAPVVMAQKGRLAGMILPDLDVLTENRPIPTIIDLDCRSGVVDAPLLSYGFADHKLVGHVYFAHDASMIKPVPWELKLGMKVLVNANAEPKAGYREASKALWDRYGHRYFDKILPQAMPFADYARVCYPAAFNEKATGGWFEHTINGQVCGGMPSGWGLYDGWVSWQCWFNQLRSAWGLRWWGKKLGEKDWVAKADKMLNLALAAPMNQGAVPTTYLSRTKEWKGSLITPSPECYYDLTNMAWKGIWMLKWLEFEDCPRTEEIQRQVDSMAKLMLRYQANDGSFPTWLTKDLKVVPILDRSAQAALPTWFLAEWHMARVSTLKTEQIGLSKLAFGDDPKSESGKKKATRIEELLRQIKAMRKEMDPKLLLASKFLRTEIVPQQRYYDFETFFSCSPKECLQRNGVIDNTKMWDLHTMQAPQNTLSMQWCAEAIAAAETAPRSGSSYYGFDRVGSANKQALMALDIMSLYQNVWPISFRKVAYTYGGFGVQNSDGEYNDARQAQFGATLCRFAEEVDRRDYFERGIAAVRASLTLINHPLHEKFGIYPNPNYPLGLEPENDGHGGTDQQNGRTGFDWGEGSGLAAAAEILDRYGEGEHIPSDWAMKIDGGTPPASARKEPEAVIHPTWDFTDWRMPGWTFEGDFLHWPTRSTRLNFNAQGKPFIGTCEDGKGGFDDEYTGTITSPLFMVRNSFGLEGGNVRSTIKLLVGGGAGPGVYVELIGEDGKRLAIERGKNTEHMDERVWDVTAHRNETLRIRIVDQEKGGWGHINVGLIRVR
jgi:hypothetical protein